MTDKEFLLNVRSILVYIGVIKKETNLCEKSWLQLKQSGFTPIKAVKEDMDGYKLPFIKWQEVQKIKSALNSSTI